MRCTAKWASHRAHGRTSFSHSHVYTGKYSGEAAKVLEQEDGGSLQPLEELIARDQIHQLVDRYAVAVDGKDIDTLGSLFADDVDNGRYGRGQEGVRTFFDHALRAFHCSMHLVGNHVIDFDDDDTAHGIVYCRAHHHVLEPEHWHDMALAYWDTYERHGGGWYFRRRDAKPWYRQWFGHPEHGTDRVVAGSGDEGATRHRGPVRGSMPDGFETFAAFWARQPAPLPDRGG
jgi:ketosteroid isomerase-like protein